MEDPKIKPRVCVVDGCFNQVADQKKKKCPACLYKELYEKKSSQIAKSGFSRKTYKKVGPAGPKKTSKFRSIKQIIHDKTKKLQGKAHKKWSIYIRTKFGTGEVSQCCTCQNPVITFGNGIWGAHAGHYYEKGKYLYFAYHILNGGIQCRSCNNDEAGEQIEMRRWLVSVHGKDLFESFEQEVIDTYTKIKSGLLPRVPDIEWYEDQIRKLDAILDSLGVD